MIVSGHTPTLVERQVTEMQRFLESGAYSVKTKSKNLWNAFMADKNLGNLDKFMSSFLSDGNKKTDIPFKLCQSLKTNLGGITEHANDSISSFDKNQASSALSQMNKILPGFDSLESSLSSMGYQDECMELSKIKSRIIEIGEELKKKVVN